MTSTAVSPASPAPAEKSPLASLFAAKADTFQLALKAKPVDWSSFKSALIADGARNERLIQCARTDPISVLGCAAVAAALGLMPGAAHGEFYLIPRNNRVKVNGEWTSRLQCTFVIGYQGLIQLAYRNPRVEVIQPVLVYRDEEFEFRPAHPTEPVHHIAPFGIKRDQESLVGGYCLAWLRDSRRPVCLVLDAADFEDARKRNVVKDKDGKEKSNAWTTDYEAMALKTLVRRIVKLLPKSTDLAKALDSEQVDPHAVEAETVRIGVDVGAQADAAIGGMAQLESGIDDQEEGEPQEGAA